MIDTAPPNSVLACADATESEAVVRVAPARGVRVALVALVLGATFYLYEHSAETYAGGARAGVSESRLSNDIVDDVETGNALRKAALITFGAFGLVALAVARDQPWNPRWLCVLATASLVAWTMASTTWSQSPDLSLRRLIATLLVALGSLGVARMLRPSELVTAALVSLAAMTTASLVIDLAAGARPWTPGERFAGTLHANNQAAYCGVLCLAAQRQAASLGWRWAPRLIFFAGLAMLGLTKSRTGVLALLVGMFVSTATRLQAGFRWAFLAVGVGVVAMAAMVVASLDDGGRTQLREIALMGRTQQSGSLTGRMPLWQELSKYASGRLATGYGYEGFWTPDRIKDVMESQGWAVVSSHNAYLEVLLQIGAVGLGLAVLVVVLGWRCLQTAFELSGDPSYGFGAGLVAFAMADSLLQAHFSEVSYPTTILVIVILNAIFFFPTGGPAASDDEPNATHSGYLTA